MFFLSVPLPWANSINLPSAGPVPVPSATAIFRLQRLLLLKNILSAKLNAGLDALYNEQPERAITLRDTMPANSLDRQTLTWAIAVSGIREITSHQFRKVMNELKNWPGKSIIYRNLERALVRENPSPQQVIALFADRKPITTDSMAILGAALLIQAGQRCPCAGHHSPVVAHSQAGQG